MTIIKLKKLKKPFGNIKKGFIFAPARTVKHFCWAGMQSEKWQSGRMHWS